MAEPSTYGDFPSVSTLRYVLADVEHEAMCVEVIGDGTTDGVAALRWYAEKLRSRIDRYEARFGHEASSGPAAQQGDSDG